MRVKVKGPQALNGEVVAPRSKAYTHRALVTSLLSRGETVIEKPLYCDDTKVTLRAVSNLGGEVSAEENGLRIHGPDTPLPPRTPIDCGESGASLRFLTAICSTSPNITTLLMSGGLSKRPILPLIKALKDLGASAQLRPASDGVEVVVQGPLKGGRAFLPGDVSSQFISGLLVAAPLALNDVEIKVEGEMESRPYINTTLNVMRKHGVEVCEEDSGFIVEAPQEYAPARHAVPGDFSSASFLIAAAETAGDHVSVSGLSTSGEPDAVILDVLSRAGATVKNSGHTIHVERSNLECFEFDARDSPDLVPVLEVLACFARGRSVVRGVRRLQFKESDRLRTVPYELEKMGAKIRVDEDRVVIEGPQKLAGHELSSHRDHRVAMACAVASLSAEGISTIDGAEAVSKSYPEFYQDLVKLGVRLDVE